MSFIPDKSWIISYDTLLYFICFHIFDAEDSKIVL